MAGAVRVFPGPFLAGYASVKVVVQFWQARAGGHNPTCLGVVLSDSSRGRHLRCSWWPVVASSGR